MTEVDTWQIQLEDYYGPLSVLYDLIQKNHMAVLKLNLNEITKQYVQYVQNLQKNVFTLKQLDEVSDYLIVAQYLIHLKSKYLLLSLQAKQEEANSLEWSEEYLTKMLLMIEEYHHGIEELSKRQSQRLLMYCKPAEQFDQFCDPNQKYEKLPTNINPKILAKYFDDLLVLQAEEKLINNYEVFEVSTSEVALRVLNYLQHHQKCFFQALFLIFYQEKRFNLYYLVTLFLAILSLNNNNQITVEEKNNDLFLALMGGNERV